MTMKKYLAERHCHVAFKFEIPVEKIVENSVDATIDGINVNTWCTTRAKEILAHIYEGQTACTPTHAPDVKVAGIWSDVLGSKGPYYGKCLAGFYFRFDLLGDSARVPTPQDVVAHADHMIGELFKGQKGVDLTTYDMSPDPSYTMMLPIGGHGGSARIVTPHEARTDAGASSTERERKTPRGGPLWPGPCFPCCGPYPGGGDCGGGAPQ